MVLTVKWFLVSTDETLLLKTAKEVPTSNSRIKPSINCRESTRKHEADFSKIRSRSGGFNQFLRSRTLHY